MKKIILFCLICTGSIGSPSAKGQVFHKDVLESRIDSLIPKQVNDTTPGLVIGVVQQGKLVFSKGYGLANLSYGISNDSKIVYNIGSVSKQFLGYAFAMLHSEGALNIDDPVDKYLEDWPVFEHTVTLRHLLTHTSGYREAYTMSNLAGRIIGVDRLSREECLEVVRKQPQLEFVPGSRYTYNSTAWVILAEILEKLTGKSADDWVETNILEPLEMNDSQIESYVGEVILNGAESYTYHQEQGYINQKSNRAIFGAAEVYSSIQDLVLWLNNYQSAEIGGKAVNDLFLDPFILNDGSDSEYALGIGISYYRGLKRYRHTGGHEAFATQLSYFPDHDLGIISISNFGAEGWVSTSKIADLLLEQFMSSSEPVENQDFDIKKGKLNEFAGLYLRSTFNGTHNLTVVNDTLTSGRGTKLIPTSQNTFRINGWDGQVQINKLSKGETELVFADGTLETYTKVEAWIPAKKELTNYEGEYWSDELETVYHLVLKDKKLKIHHRWLGEISLEPVSRDFFNTDWGYYVLFIRNSMGEISGLSINSGRTLDVRFQRKE